MAGGVSLGGAYFELQASAAPLIQALSQAESASQKSVQAIAQQLGKSERDVQRLAQQWLTAEKQRADASAAATLKIIKAHNDAAEAAAKAGGGFAELAKAALGVGAAFAGVQLGVEGVRKALDATVEATLKADQAQRTLTASFGSSAAAYKQYADTLAASNNQINATVEAGVARIGALQRNYALTSDTIQSLSKAGSNMAAVFGGEVGEAFKSSASGVRGEAEEIEKYNIFIQDSSIKTTKAFQSLDPVLQKHWETLSEVTKARVRAAAILEQAAPLEEAAKQRAESAAGGFDRLKRATNELEVALGKTFVPTLGAAAGALAGVVNTWAGMVTVLGKLPEQQSGAEKSIDALALAALRAGGPLGQMAAGLIELRRAAQEMGLLSKPEATNETGLPHGPDPGDVRAIQAQLAAEAKDRAMILQKQREQEAKDGIEAAEQIHRREVKDLDARKTLLEAEKEAKLRAVDTEKEAALAGIETEARAAKAASDARIAQLRVEQEEASRAAARRHEDATRALDAEARAVKDAGDEHIRNLEIERDRDKQASEDRRDAAIRDLDLAKRERDDARVQEDRSEEDSVTRRTRIETDRHKHEMDNLDDEAKAAQQKHDAAVRGLEDEATRADRAHERAIRSIERESRAEDDRHAKALRALQEEEDARLGVLDAQIKALDAAEKQVDAADRLANLTKKQSDAQAALTRAQGTGTPEQVAAAREELTGAIQGGNEIAVANARERLQRLAGQGAEAVKKAQEDLAAATGDIQKEQTRQVHDAERDRLQAAKDAIKEELDARKQAENDRDAARKRDLEADKRAADDKLKRVKDGVAAQKQAADDGLKIVKDGLDRRKDAEQATHDNNVRLLQDQTLKEKREIDDRRRAEDQADQDRRHEIQEAFAEEERIRHARYDDEATGEIPAIKRAVTAAEDGFRARKIAADDAFHDEQQQIADTYTKPGTGLIPVAEDAAQKVAQGFRDQSAAITAEATNQKRDINDVYSNAAKTGLIDLIEKARADSAEKLQNQRDYWKDWAEDLGGENGQIAKVIKKFDELIGKIKDVGGTVNVTVPSFRGDASDGGGPGPGVGAGSGEVPEPYQVQFPFGARYSDPFNAGIPIHRGVDVTVKGAPNGGKGSPVEAFEDGEVVYDAYDPNGGNGIIIKGTDGLYHRYFHFDSTNVSKGDEVHRGDVIGTLGETGTEGSPHLHYEVSKNQGGDPINDLIDPVPYMNKGGGSRRQQGGRTFEFDLFGRHFTVTLPGGVGGDALIRAIEQLGEKIGGREFGRAAASIALSEGADGDLTQPGAGGARGPFQFDPGGELPHYAAYLHKSLDAAGDYAGTHPLDAAAWALRGYLGDALREGLDQGLKGADLAEYGSLIGQRPEGDNYKRAGDASRRLWGYRNGGWIPTPSLIVDAATMRPYAYAGEAGPERVLSPEHSAAWASGSNAGAGDSTVITVTGIGLNEVASEIERRQRKARMLRGRVRSW